jgi:integrase/recombinase XerD
MNMGMNLTKDHCIAIIEHRNSPIGDYAGKFLSHLEIEHYAKGTRDEYARFICALNLQMKKHKVDINALDEDNAVRLIKRMRRFSSRRTWAAFAVRKFVSYLNDSGVGKPSESAGLDESDRGRLKRDYAEYLRIQRGLSEGTIEQCWRYADYFLKFRFGEQCGDLSKITALDIVSFLQQLTSRGKPLRDKTPPSNLRNFFRYLFKKGKTATNLALCIPSIKQKYGARLPRYLKPDQVASLIKAVKTDMPTGRRNYAMVLLLARLGLRAPEVIAMQIDDIDWRAGRIMVRGKGQRHDWLPLPKDVGEAIADYLQRDRIGNSRALFVANSAPHRPFKDGQILNAVIKDAFARAGIKPPVPYVGSHVLRHSLAAALAQRGASLDEIADMLRHHSRSSTMIYAKVDIEGLRSISQPWPVPGGAR